MQDHGANSRENDSEAGVALGGIDADPCQDDETRRFDSAESLPAESRQIADRRVVVSAEEVRDPDLAPGLVAYLAELPGLEALPIEEQWSLIGPITKALCDHDCGTVTVTVMAPADGYPPRPLFEIAREVRGDTLPENRTLRDLSAAFAEVLGGEPEQWQWTAAE